MELECTIPEVRNLDEVRELMTKIANLSITKHIITKEEGIQ